MHLVDGRPGVMVEAIALLAASISGVVIAQASGEPPFLQYGALGLVGIVILWVTGRLINWMTSTLNGKLDRNAEATTKNTEAVTKLADAIKDLAREVRSDREERRRRG